MDQLSELIVMTASRCLLGREIRETLFSEVSTLVHDLDKGMVGRCTFAPGSPQVELWLTPSCPQVVPG
jgi:sterol 14-demethylase